MKVKNQGEWERVLEANPEDSYGGRILRFAERWALRMEARLASGFEAMGDIALETKDETNLRLTDIQLCQAVVALAKHWEHGADLKVWYGKRRQAGEERTCT